MYFLGVLHHVPDTQAAIRSCVGLLKPGAPLLLYFYYAFDNRVLVVSGVMEFVGIRQTADM